MSYRRTSIKVGDSDGEVQLNKEGILLTGEAIQHDDVAFNLAGKKLYTSAGTVDLDYDKICASFSASDSGMAKSSIFSYKPTPIIRA